MTAPGGPAAGDPAAGDPAAGDPAAGGSRWLVPALLIVSLVVATIGSLGAPLITSVATDLKVSLASAQWTLTITLLAGAVATPVLGRLGSGPGRRATVITTLAIVLAGSILTVARSAWAGCSPGAPRRARDWGPCAAAGKRVMNQAMPGGTRQPPGARIAAWTKSLATARTSYSSASTGLIPPCARVPTPRAWPGGRDPG